jgi:hypothetical protein
VLTQRPPSLTSLHRLPSPNPRGRAAPLERPRGPTSPRLGTEEHAQFKRADHQHDDPEGDVVRQREPAGREGAQGERSGEEPDAENEIYPGHFFYGNAPPEGGSLESQQDSCARRRPNRLEGTKGSVEVSKLPAPLPGRPFYITIDGGRLYVSVHDAYHLERERQFKRQIRLAHPDCNRQRWACSRTRNLLKARARWEAEEARWYARVGLEPPTRLPQRTSSSVNGGPPTVRASPLPLLSPAADQKSSGSSLRTTRASMAIHRRDDGDLACVIRVRAEPDVTPSSIPTCHSPPDVWPAAA